MHQFVTALTVMLISQLEDDITQDYHSVAQ